LWAQIGTATAVGLGGRGFDADIGLVAAIAVVVATGLFAVQIITSVLRRDHGGLARAGRGVLVAFVGGGAAIAVTNLLLAAVDALSSGVVHAATGGTITQLGGRLFAATAVSSLANPAAQLLLSLIVIGAVVVVWAAMMIRKLLIIVAAIFAPAAFAGAAADITTGWVRRWIETMIALVVSKLVLVFIFVIGLGVLAGGVGEASGPGTPGTGGAGQDVTQLVVGALILLLAGFAPWLALKLVHFTGDHFAHLHALSGYATAGAATAVAAPQKIHSLSGRLNTPGRQPDGQAGVQKPPEPGQPGANSGRSGGPAGAATAGTSGAAGGAAAAAAAGAAAAAAAKRSAANQARAASTVANGAGREPPAHSGSGQDLPGEPPPPKPPWPRPDGRAEGDDR
jgi:hypothetical protein